ncbi:MAG: endonuclease III [Candidatus Methanomethylicia archaeon]
MSYHFNPQAFLNMLVNGVKLNYDDYAAIIASRSSDPFKLLIMTILSQNTNDKNAIKAYSNLSSKYDINAKTLSKISPVELAELIKPAGLHFNRANRIIALSKIILENYNSDLNNILNLPCDVARRILLSLPGIGLKTADVLLLFTGRCAIFPVDTHITRVSKRLGVVDVKAKYEYIQSFWIKNYPESEYLRLHLLLIALGREFCSARNPKHNICPVRFMCKTWFQISF